MNVSTSVRYPTYEKVDDSPSLDGPGIAVRIRPPAQGSTVYRPDGPIILTGTVGAPGSFVRGGDTDLLARVALIVFRKDGAGSWVRSVMHIHAPPRPQEPPPGKDSGLEYTLHAYFAVDLAKLVDFPDEAGRYWVMAAVGDWVSDRVDFQVDQR
jgi:hypothetical protein